MTSHPPDPDAVDRDAVDPIIPDFAQVTAPSQAWPFLAHKAHEMKITDFFFSRGGLYARWKGHVAPLVAGAQISPALYSHLMESVIPSERHRASLNGDHGSTDFAFSIGQNRFRANFFRDSLGYSGACRPLPTRSFAPDEIGLDKRIVERVANLSRGMVLVTGPTGSGKSSTICSLIDHINATRQYNIVTIEDPIEYVFTPKKSIIYQREVGRDVDSFAVALRAAMRQAPNVIFVGEMRDFETVLTALQAAETGHIVFSTLHTQRVFATISRIIDIAPDGAKEEVRTVLAASLRLILGQRLLPRKDGSGLVAAREVYISTPSGEAKIRGGKEKTLSDEMISGRDLGMVEWDMCLTKLLKDGHIAQAEYDHHKDSV